MNDAAAGGPSQDVQTTGKRIAATLLRNALGFRDCDDAAIDALTETGLIATLGKGESLVRRGDPFQALAVLVEGALESSVTQRDGRRHLLAHLRPGDISGISALWDQLPHMTDLIARESETRVLLVRAQRYVTLRDRYPCLARALEVQMAFRSRLLFERTMADTSMSLDVRLARVLHMMAVLSGRTQPGAAHLSMRVSQADIGDFLGVSRQRANFAVQQLKRLGLIELSYSAVTISDLPGLARHGGL